MRTITITTSESVACEILAIIGRRLHELEDKQKELRAKGAHSLANEYEITADGLRKVHNELFGQLS